MLPLSSDELRVVRRALLEHERKADGMGLVAEAEASKRLAEFVGRHIALAEKPLVPSIPDRSELNQA